MNRVNVHVASFVVCIPILFLRVSSLHALVFIQKTFCDLFLFFFVLFL